jgi:hypothetical protein
MSTSFTSPGDPKTDYRITSIPASQKFAAVDYEKIRQAILQIQVYLASGTLDAAVTHTLTDLDLLITADPAVGPEMDWGGNRGRWFVGIDVANAPTSRDFVITGQRGTYSFSDGAITTGSPTLTSASGGGFVVSLVGSVISGIGIPVGTTIAAVGSTGSLTMSANATATASAVSVTVVRASVQDLMYWRHRGALSATLGIGVTPPDGSARLQVSPQDDEPAMGGARIRVGPSQTGKALVVHDSSPTDQWWIDSSFFMSGPSGVKMKADPSAAGHVLTLCDPNGVNQYSFDQPTGSGGVLRLRQTTNNATIMDFGTDGSVRHLSTKFGAFSANPITRPTVTGSRGGNAAVASLITAMASLGWVIDNTTA